MKILSIPCRKSLLGLTIEEVVERLPYEGTSLDINQINWPKEYPYCPETRVFVAHDRQKLHFLFCVRGRQLKALAVEDHQPVWEDSCVEFFCQEPGKPYYMNFEANCIGTMTASRRLGQNEGVERLNSEEMRMIRRFSSLKKERIDEIDGIFDWKVAISVPLCLICSGFVEFPHSLKANFYKCADKTKTPHFVSWQPINLPQPLFHCPEFFGFMVLEA